MSPQKERAGSTKKISSLMESACSSSTTHVLEGLGTLASPKYWANCGRKKLTSGAVRSIPELNRPKTEFIEILLTRAVQPSLRCVGLRKLSAGHLKTSTLPFRYGASGPTLNKKVFVFIGVVLQSSRSSAQLL